MKPKSIIYLIRLPGHEPITIGLKASATRLGLTPTHVRRIILGERTKTPAFIKNIDVKEIVYHG